MFTEDCCCNYLYLCFGRDKEKKKENFITLGELKNKINNGSIKYDDIPKPFIDPLTMDLMLEPVVADDGHTYDYSTLVSMKQLISPFTGLPIDNCVISNFSLQTQIFDWLKDIKIETSICRNKSQRYIHDPYSNHSLSASGIIKIIEDKYKTINDFKKFTDYILDSIDMQSEWWQDMVFTYLFDLPISEKKIPAYVLIHKMFNKILNTTNAPLRWTELYNKIVSKYKKDLEDYENKLLLELNELKLQIDNEAKIIRDNLNKKSNYMKILDEKDFVCI